MSGRGEPHFFLRGTRDTAPSFSSPNVHHLFSIVTSDPISDTGAGGGGRIVFIVELSNGGSKGGSSDLGGGFPASTVFVHPI